MRRLLQLLALALVAVTSPVAAEAPYYYAPFYNYAWVPAPTPRQLTPLARTERAAIAAYGPFRVLDSRTAALVGVTDGRTPAAFRRMLRDYPHIAMLQFVECPGTHDDLANLALGRMIRAAGISAEVPAGGSVRSGAVELVLAAASLTIDDRAEFAVHAWLDEDGFGANDYAADSPEHRKYLSYYREMGMGAEQAASFYAMTNSVPFESARWLSGVEMRRWVGRGAPVSPRPQFAAAAAAQPMGAPANTRTAPPPPQFAAARSTLPSSPAGVVVQAPLAAPAYVPATAFLTPVPLPAIEPAPAAPAPAPRLAYLDLALTLF